MQNKATRRWDAWVRARHFVITAQWIPPLPHERRGYWKYWLGVELYGEAQDVNTVLRRCRAYLLKEYDYGVYAKDEVTISEIEVSA